jgi:hypothetical protein
VPYRDDPGSVSMYRVSGAVIAALGIALALVLR